MKRIYLIAIVSVFSLVCFSCRSSNRDQAISVGNKYMDAFMRVDPLEMAKFASPGIAGEFRMNHRRDSTGYHDMLREEFGKMGNTYVLDERASDIEKNEAELIYRIKQQDRDIVWATVELEMSRLDGKWLITDVDVDYPER